MRTRLVNRTVAFAAILALVIGITAPVAASAAENNIERKLGRALAALTCGFLEVPGNVVQLWRERGAPWGFTLGIAVGLGKTIPRALVGAYELASFPFPAPKGYVPIMEPEFPWQYFDDPQPSHR